MCKEMLWHVGRDGRNKFCTGNCTGFGNGYELWAIIQRQELSSDLLQVITEWAVNRDKNHFMWGAESLILNTIVNDSRNKAKLLEA